MNKEEIKYTINNYRKEMLDNLAEFVSINSIYDEKTVDEKNPFGKGVSKALDFIYNLSKKDGFEVTNYNNYCVEITYGEGELLDILAHADVVEVSEHWDFDPFSKKYDDKFIYGRGTQDDKGPLLAAYYALKALKDNNIKVNKKIRFIVGGNEESGSACLDYYYNKLHKPFPSLGFTPDADFPLINGEKGIAILKLTYKNLDKAFSKITGGMAHNIVMPEVDLTINGEDKKYLGKAVHASTPEKGLNAFVVALKALKDQYKDFDKLYNDLYDYNGKGFGIDTYSESLKELTMNIGKVELVNNDLQILLDIRYPDTISAKQIKEAIAIKGYEVDLLEYEDPIYMPKDSKLVKTLLNSYDYFMNTKSEAMTIGGGTYAKSSKNVVAFGMLFPGDIDLMHQDNEKLSVDHYFLGAQIYLKALLDLVK